MVREEGDESRVVREGDESRMVREMRVEVEALQLSHTYTGVRNSSFNVRELE